VQRNRLKRNVENEIAPHTFSTFPFHSMKTLEAFVVAITGVVASCPASMPQATELVAVQLV
jgi:hypothetical protein